MRYTSGTLLIAVGLLAAGCNSNTAPGNDREARLDRTAPAAETATAGAAIAGVETGLLKPEIMTDADLSRIGAVGERCLFRFTEVGLPVFVYSSAGNAAATIKLNGKLVALDATGDGRFAADGVEAAVRALDDSGETNGPFKAEFVVWFPSAPNELGFHGFAECSAGG